MLSSVSPGGNYGSRHLTSCWGPCEAGDASKFLLLGIQEGVYAEPPAHTVLGRGCGGCLPGVEAGGGGEVHGLPPQGRVLSGLPSPSSAQPGSGGGGSWPPRGSLGTPSLPFSPAFGTIDKMFIPPPAHMLFAVMTVISGANAAFSRRQSIRLITAWEAGLFKFKW